MSRKMKLDFTGVESFQRMSEGVHVCKIATADVKESGAGNDMIVVAFEAIKGVDKGSRVFANYVLTDTALWKLKGLLQAIGMKADGKVQLDLDKLIGKTCSVTVKHEEYDGKLRARVEDVAKIAATSDSDDAEEEDDDEKFMNVEEDEDEEEEKPVKKEKKATPPKKAEPEEDDDDDWDDDEEEEEPAPKKKAKEEKKPEKSEKKPVKKATDDDDDWDDDDWDEED